MTERPTEQTHPRLNGLDASSTTAPTLPPMPAAPESDRPEYRPQTSEPARPSLAERLQQKVSTVRQAERPAERLDSTSVRPDRTDESEYVRRTIRGEPQENDIVLVHEGGGTGKCALV